VNRKVDHTGRSTGKLAGKHRQIEGQFQPHTIDLLCSPAMRVLSLTGRRVLDRLEIELCKHAGFNNGALVLTYDDLVQFYEMDRHAIAPAIHELTALGLVEVTETGRAGNREFRKPSLYRLTYLPTDTAAPTNEWKRIIDSDQATAVAKRGRALKTGSKRVKRNKKASVAKQPSLVGKIHAKNRAISVGKTRLKDINSLVGKTPSTLYISGLSPSPETSSIDAAMAAIRAAVGEA
jgi:hypothetical protein